MKKSEFGIILLIAGILLGIYAMIMDVGVNAEMHGMFDELYKQNPNMIPDKIANADMLNRRLCFIVIAATLCIVGAVFTGSEVKDDILVRHARAQTKILSLMAIQADVDCSHLNPVIEEINDTNPMLFEYEAEIENTGQPG